MKITDIKGFEEIESLNSETLNKILKKPEKSARVISTLVEQVIANLSESSDQLKAKKFLQEIEIINKEYQTRDCPQKNQIKASTERLKSSIREVFNKEKGSNKIKKSSALFETPQENKQHTRSVQSAIIKTHEHKKERLFDQFKQGVLL